MRLKFWFIFFLVLLFLPACYNMVKKDAGFVFQKTPSEVSRFLSILEQKNNAITSFKGIGKISIWDSEGSRTSRAAWLGAVDGRLRIEFLGLPGQPVAKFIFDGKQYSFMSHMDSEVYSKTSSDPDLEPVTGVSIKTSEVIEYLAGGIPVYEHDAVFLESSESGDIDVLVFKKNWLGVVEKIFFNGSGIEKVEIFKWGSKVYQVEFKDLSAGSKHSGPKHSGPSYLVIDNGGAQGFSFAVDRQWTDINVLPSMFEITPAN
ncbi:MAG: hypothetical protein PF482_20980 [Desulfobacteraceae bacterium]|jgi:hypothetical protein|nr:hypothetical protein [Desulfobacteraceae bacterium]